MSKKERILNVALKLFARKGFAETTVDEIAARAGVSKGLIYHHFTDKQELVDCILLGTIGQISRRMEAVTADKEPRDMLIGIINLMFELVEDDPVFFQLYESLLFQPALAEVMHSDLMSMFTEMVSTFEECFTKLGTKNPSGEAWLLGATLDGIILDYSFSPDTVPLSSMKEALFVRYGFDVGQSDR